MSSQNAPHHQPPSHRPFTKIFVFSHPRTMSNLFLRFFAHHLEIGVVDYPFDAAYMAGPERQARRHNPKIDALVKARKEADHHVTYQMAFDEMRERIREIEGEGRVAIIKQPIYDIADPAIIIKNVPSAGPPLGRTPSITVPDGKPRQNDPSLPPNPTILPSSFMDSLLPIILIRHPALMIPSYYRVARDIHGARVDDAEFPINATLRWSRLVLEYYLAQAAVTAVNPIVIDASDLVGPDTEALLAKLCRLAGISPEFVQLQWTRPLEQQVGSISEGTKAFRKVFLESTGVMRREQKGKESGEGGEVIIAEEVRRWEEEFGAEAAEALRRLVELAMSDWDYLKGFALRADK